MTNRGAFILYPALSMSPVAPTPDPGLSWLTVSAAGIVGSADSADAGKDPDYTPVAGTVTFVPTFSRPIRLISEQKFFAVAATSATFDSSGELTFDGGKDVRLIAPLWAELSDQTWKWRATVRPGGDQGWASFEIEFTGAPGDVVDLASFL